MSPVDDDETTRSWTEYRRLVLGELERLNASMALFDRKLDDLSATHRRELNQRDSELATKISKLEVEVAMLQVKSGAWGAAAGLLVVVASVLLKIGVK